jgi:mono/diheme cytochrome c family protein
MTTRVPALVAFVAGFASATVASAQPQPVLKPTFNKDVAPIFFEHCTTCHRPGEVAPMSLLTFKDARPWARSIATQVAKGAMPPWHADPSIGHFANARRLTDEQKTTIARWVETGAPEGDPKDLPGQPEYTPGWNIGQPDAVLEMQEDYALPATGEVPYVYFEVPTNFTEDRWIQAWEVRPGNAAAVHHVIVYVRPPQEAAETAATSGAAGPGGAATPRPPRVVTMAEGMEIPEGQTGGRVLPDDPRTKFPNYRPRPRGTAGSIGGFVPGNGMRTFPAGTAMRLPKGSSLVFQMHYTPTGKETTDRTKMGLVFAKEPPKMPLSGTALVNGALHIPAGAPNHRVDAEMTLNRDLLLFSMTPHTHVRGIRWYYEAQYPDGRTEAILSIPNYDFDWQHEYRFARPLELPAGTKIKASAWYDNSPANKSNPDPTKDVWWGDQTWEEMMFTSFTWHVKAGGR